MSASPIHRLILENGITLLVMENTAVELVAGGFFSKMRVLVGKKPKKRVYFVF